MARGFGRTARRDGVRRHANRQRALPAGDPMATHENSLAAFRALITNGSLSESRLIAAHALWTHPEGMTANELDRYLSPGVINSRYSRRLIELERMGIVARSGARECSVSGNRCDVWQYAPHAPVERPAVPRMPTPEEAAWLVEAFDMGCRAPIGEWYILREWLAAGAPRCAEARRIPKGH